MASISAAGRAIADHYGSRIDQFQSEYQHWADIRLTHTNGKSIMPNEYVCQDVINWLVTHLGGVYESSRMNKYIKAQTWAYSQGRPIGFRPENKVMAYAHHFFFKNPDDAMRFKLTWV